MIEVEEKEGASKAPEKTEEKPKPQKIVISRVSGVYRFDGVGYVKVTSKKDKLTRWYPASENLQGSYTITLKEFNKLKTI